MGGSFATKDEHSHLNLRPLRVPRLKEEIYREAKEMVESLEAWELVAEDPDKGLLTCTRKPRFLGGEARVTIAVEGPEGIPSATVSVRSETEGGLLSHDKANVMEFMKPFHRRVC